MSVPVSEEVKRRILRSHDELFSPVACQIEGYNYFMRDLLHAIIQENSDIFIRHKKKTHAIKFGNVTVIRPHHKEADGSVTNVMPSECRLRRLNYSCSVVGDIVHTVTDDGVVTEINERLEVPLFQMPCMVGSDYCWRHTSGFDTKECPYDLGGYFVVNGVEKVLQPQLKLRHNKVFVWATKDAKQPFVAEIRSCHPSRWRSTSTVKAILIHTAGYDDIIVNLPFVNRGTVPLDIPLTYLLSMLGVENYSDMIDTIAPVGTPLAIRSAVARMIERNGIETFSKEASQAWLASNTATRDRSGNESTTRGGYATHIVKNELFPHLGMEETDEIEKAKAMYLGYIVRSILMVRGGTKPPDDRDHNNCKRLDTAGSLLAMLFRQLWRAHLKHARLQLMKAIEQEKGWLNVVEFISSRRIEVGWRYHFSTGNWSLNKKVTSTLTGVVQMKTTTSPQASLSHIRRVSIPLNRDGKTPKPRQLESSDYGIYCVSETPEGQACGLLKTLAILARVSIAVNHDVFVRLVRGIVSEFAQTGTSGAGIPVMVNGTPAGYVDVNHVEETKIRLRRARRTGRLPSTTSVASDCIGVYVHADDGRVCRPLFVLENMHKLPGVLEDNYHSTDLFAILMQQGIVEYVDKQEEYEHVVAVDEAQAASGECSHMEIHPTSLFGHSTAAIPFSNHNQAPRNMYQTSMVKQAIAGRPSLVDKYRCDIHAHSLVYPMRPMVTTLGYEDTTTNGTGTGQEAIVAIMSYSGYNQEDSVLFNIHAAQRGLGDIFSTHTYRAELRQTGTEQEQFEIPDKNCTGKQNPDAYTHLSADGVVNVGAFVKGGDVLIGRTCTSLVYNQCGEQELSKIDRSVHLPRKPGVEGVVARVARYMSKDGNPSISIIIRQHRRVMRGDKWSSRHGQKGTVGRLVPAEDMPFSAKTGMIPDIVMNPHAIPSRMTIGHLMETLMGKAVATGAIDGDATAFSGRDVEEIGDALEKSGYNRQGTEIFVDGRSGKQMEAAVFVGPIYYQRLSHLVEKKIHSRARTGPRAVLTRQPLEGRSKDGGLRFGEMERDSLLAHGAAFTQVDKMVACSDEFSVYVCANCGTFASPPSTNAFRYKTEFRTKPMCTTCRTHDCKLAKIPYAFKLLTQELLAMGIVARMTLRPRDLST